MVPVTVAQPDLVDRCQVDLHSPCILQQRDLSNSGVPEDAQPGILKVDQRGKSVLGKEGFFREPFDRFCRLDEQISPVVNQHRDRDAPRFTKVLKFLHRSPPANLSCRCWRTIVRCPRNTIRIVLVTTACHAGFW